LEGSKQSIRFLIKRKSVVRIALQPPAELCFVLSLLIFLGQLIDMSMEVKETYESLIHRSQLKTDMFGEFNTNEVLRKHLHFGVIGHNGELEKGTGDGVTREVISTFFDEFYSSCCVGADELVPIIRHDMLKDEWEAVARIICYGTTYRYFPIRLSMVFVKSAFLGGEDFLSEEELLSSFLNYVSKDEKDILEKNITEFDENTDDLLDVLSSYNCYSSPTRTNLREILQQLAHTQLVQKPRYVANCWHNVFKNVKLPIIFNDLQGLYENLLPTGRKVVRLFKTEESHNESDQQKACKEHLKRYVKNLSTSDLRKFLQISTGSDIISTDEITITYSFLTGFSRRPVFRTCGPTIELPGTYTCFSELSEEFQSILKNPREAFNFNII